MDIHLIPIGYIRTSEYSKYELPRQATQKVHSTTYIELLPHQNYEQAIDDLIGFSYIWILSYFEGNILTKPKILTPLSRDKKGVFATRSPHRPNPLGLSAVPIISIEGRNIYIGTNDLLNGTPVVDIKPYLPHADAFPTASIGWMHGLIESHYSLHIDEDCDTNWKNFAEISPENHHYVDELLRKDPLPHPYRRIKVIEENRYLVAVKLWRILYEVQENLVTILAVNVASDYDIDQAKCQGYPTKYFKEVELFLQRMMDNNSEKKY